jgi:predicted lipoprotein with Yx(FWY)xxD motif
MPMNHGSGAPRALPGTSLGAAAAFAVLAAAILLLQPPKLRAAGASGAVVTTAKTSLGRILVDPSGKDARPLRERRERKERVLGRVRNLWPPLIASGKPPAAGGAKTSLIGTTRRADGGLQVTYNHHPLYRFAQDTKKGQTHGEGIDAFGGHGYVVSPAGSVVRRSGGGY